MLSLLFKMTNKHRRFHQRLIIFWCLHCGSCMIVSHQIRITRFVADHSKWHTSPCESLMFPSRAPSAHLCPFHFLPRCAHFYHLFGTALSKHPRPQHSHFYDTKRSIREFHSFCLVSCSWSPDQSVEDLGQSLWMFCWSETNARDTTTCAALGPTFFPQRHEICWLFLLRSHFGHRSCFITKRKEDQKTSTGFLLLKRKNTILSLTTVTIIQPCMNHLWRLPRGRPNEGQGSHFIFIKGTGSRVTGLHYQYFDFLW